MSARMLLLLSSLTFGLSNCGEKSKTPDFIDLVERCWSYVDTGNLSARGLYQVPDTNPLRTYDDRSANLRVQYAGTSLDDLFCAVYNYEVAWSNTDRDAMFDIIEEAEPEWVASRNAALPDEVIRASTNKQDYTRYLLYRANSGGMAFLVIYEESDTGFVTVIVGRGSIGR